MTRESKRARRRTLFAGLAEDIRGHYAAHKQAQAVGLQHTGAAAIQTVRAALAAFELPPLTLRWAGTHRLAGSGAHDTREGCVTIEVTARSISGVDVTFDIPVMVHEGVLLEPSCVLVHGQPRTLAQSTFDDLVRRATVTAPQANRRSMFSPNIDDRAPQLRVPLVRPGLFRSAAAQLHVGDAVALKRALNLPCRDGTRIDMPSGSEGRILRDVDGTGQCFIVAFDDALAHGLVYADDLKSA